MAGTVKRIVALPGRVVRSTSVATRLSLVVVLVALVSLVITSLVGLQRGSDLADTLLRSKLTSIGAARADEVERYIGGLERATIGLAISPSTAEAISTFTDAFEQLNTERLSLRDEEAVDQYYTDVVAPELAAARERPVSAASLVPRAPAAVALQANYVVPGGDSGGLLTDAGDGSEWSELHSSLHESFDEFVIQTGVDDLYLIEPGGHVIVYSVSKQIDFATSLLTGPQSGSGLAVLINSVGDEPEAGVTEIRDFTSYAAAGDEPSLFVASPVFADGRLAGYVALRIGPDRISEITTNNGSWEALGSTGETFVVASDDLMRSDARGFIEDESQYLDDVAEQGAATERQINSMRRFGTTVIFQPVDNKDVAEALELEPDLVEATSYLGTDVLQARRALDIEGLEWAMIAEVEREEIESPIGDFARNLLIAIALFLVAITFIAVRWSDRLVQPLRVISANLREVRAGRAIERGESSAALPDDSPAEFVELAGDIDSMLETLAARNAAAAEGAAERRRLLRRILPPQAAHRAEAGERNVVDQVANASVAVVVISGLGPLLRTHSADEVRHFLDHFVEEADALARQRGLERIRLTGDEYYAACGTVRPYIDHATRTVAFALDVRDLLRDLADDQAITMTVGIDSGPVTVGLTGGAGLVFDAWGPTVQNAADLAHRGAVNDVLVSSATRSQVSSSFETDDAAAVIDGTGAAVVSGRANEEAGAT